MAYSDYGGYAYRNGIRVPERSDAVVSTDGIKSTPGMWPGFVIPEGRGGGSQHALLGDGEVLVGLYKQSSLTFFLDGKECEAVKFLDNPAPEMVDEWEGKKYLNTDHFKTMEEPAHFDILGHKLVVYFLVTDNHYVYAKLMQPDGTVWTGFSGYGVGAGLEDCGYGYSTDECESELFRLFPNNSEAAA